jgi:predicted DNA-binding transcriptional regulator YafY
VFYKNILRLIVEALASPRGAMIADLAERLEVDASTVWRYLKALAERGAPIEGFPGGPFKYGRPQWRLFTEESGVDLGERQGRR